MLRASCGGRGLTLPSCPRHKRDGSSRYRGHKRRLWRKQGGTVGTFFKASPLKNFRGEAFLFFIHHSSPRKRRNFAMSENQNNQYTFENEEYRKTYWHTCSHILAQA